MKLFTLLFSFLIAMNVAIAETKTVQEQRPLTALGQKDGALIKAAFEGDIDLVKTVVTKGADIEARDQKKRTALMWAAANGHADIVEFLQEKGADVNAKDGDHQTALIYAARKSSIPTIKILLENGAEANAQSKKRGVTALMIAASHGNEDVVRMLLEHGAKTDVVDIFGSTAGDRARRYSNTAVVTMLDEELQD